MKRYKVKRDTNSLIKDELLTREAIEKRGYNLSLFDDIDIPSSLTYFSFGVWHIDSYFSDKIAYFATSAFSGILITNLVDTLEGYDVYFIVNEYFYRKRKLHIDCEKPYFTYYGTKYFLDDFMRLS